MSVEKCKTFLEVRKLIHARACAVLCPLVLPKCCIVTTILWARKPFCFQLWADAVELAQIE
jgi:hypothetical protein